MTKPTPANPASPSPVAPAPNNAEPAPGAAATPPADPAESTETPPTAVAQNYDEWIKGQPEETRMLVEGHISGLVNALNSLKDDRKALKAEVDALRTSAEQGSPQIQQQLAQLSENLNASSTRLEFYEAAHEAGIVDLRLAFLAFDNDPDKEGISDRRGNVDFEKFLERYPLFARQQSAPPTPASPTLAGAGVAATPQPQPRNMNQMIRRAAGR